jgi:hypothetical protein
MCLGRAPLRATIDERECERAVLYTRLLQRTERQMRERRLWRGAAAFAALQRLYDTLVRALELTDERIDGRWAPHVAALARAVLEGHATAEAHADWLRKQYPDQSWE